MQKARTIKWTPCVLLFAFCVIATTARAQTPPTLNEIILRAKEDKGREALGQKNPAGSKDADNVNPVAEAPQLVALYGVGAAMKAELSYDGRIRVIEKSGPLENFGPWVHIEIQDKGVRLTSRQWTNRSASGSAKKGQTVPVYTERTCSEKAGCLQLSVAPGAQGRGASAQAVDPMAALLMTQQPLGGTLPFLGKPGSVAPINR